MIETNVFLTLLVLAISFIIIGYVKKQPVLFIFAGVFFFLSSYMVFTGLQYESGLAFNPVNETNQVVTYNYTTWSSPLKNPFGVGLDLMGLYYVIVGVIGIFGNKPEREHSDEEN